MYFTDIAQLLHKFGVPQYEPKDWRLFIDSSKWSLKCVLLHNGNQFASVPLVHLTTLKEKYEAVKYVLEKICYAQHELLICVDLKIVNFLLGQQSSLTKHLCFLCMWDSRNTAQYYTKKDWPVQEELVPWRARNVINNPLVDRDKILFPPLHIKLGLIKQFSKALDKDDGCFTYLCHTYPGLIESWHFWWSSNLSAQKGYWIWKLNERNGTGNMEGFCSGREELFLATTSTGTMQNLSLICWLLSKKPCMQHEHQNA